MGRPRRPRGRQVDGILLLDKPLGITSNDALQKVKRLYFAQKAGHTGSLDPLADGLLPICFGNATKLSAFLLDADKYYWVRVKLGETTTTQDAEGEVVKTRPAEHITEADVRAVIPRFLGPVEQLPPMYSAVKHEGQRLYKLAREGKEVERKPRTITIHELELTHFEPGIFEMQVHCSKGTYIRTLAEDMGEMLGCGAHVIGLRRTGVGPYTTEGMVTLDQLNAIFDEDKFQLDKLLIPIDSALANWPAVHLNEDSTYYVKMGQPVLVPKAPTEGWVRLYDANGDFMGVGEVDDDGRIAPRRMMAGG